jgi:hypothetical protein
MKVGGYKLKLRTAYKGTEGVHGFGSFLPWMLAVSHCSEEN